ncbi:MAG TPA: hypothetical protein PKA10_11665 [Selenomonadales bacterium]|nr:hypothetical protein [Selenomonadales bacterium]
MLTLNNQLIQRYLFRLNYRRKLQRLDNARIDFEAVVVVTALAIFIIMAALILAV